MIREVEIRGFKPYVADRIIMAPLTVLAGLNGSGKTSFIQTILLCCHASKTRSSAISLNGPYGLELGTAGDVLNWSSQSPIQVSMHDVEGEEFLWEFETPTETSLYLDVLKKPKNSIALFGNSSRSFTYLSAERLGPRGVNDTSAIPESEMEIGSCGEFTAHLLSASGDKVLAHADRSHPLNLERQPKLLKYEVERWLSEITRTIEVNGTRNPTSNVSELSYRVSGSTWVKSTNMGFGITYSLPIILAGLIAEPGSMLVVENPEAHLHPAGQSRIGVFLAWLAGKGVQVVLETHSDHVLNGIRLAIAKYKYLSHEKAVVHFFSDSMGSEDQLNIAPLSISANGSISDWPSGFFDQYQVDVATLGQVRRGS